MTPDLTRDYFNIGLRIKYEMFIERLLGSYSDLSHLELSESPSTQIDRSLNDGSSIIEADLSASVVVEKSTNKSAKKTARKTLYDMSFSFPFDKISKRTEKALEEKKN